jgi:hypothetical protein
MSFKFVALASLLSALAIGPAVTLATTSTTHVNPEARGVARARAAGVKITPAAARFMERWPIGSCVNDPEQPKCPPIKSFVMAGQRPRRPRRIERPYLIHRPCYIDNYYLGRKWSNAWGKSWLICHYVSWDEAFVSLEEDTHDAGYKLMASGKVSQGPSGHKISQQAHRFCRLGYARRWWRMTTYAAWLFPDEQWDGYNKSRTDLLGCLV